jgi:NAD(P)-dependent dehydrogenase (short-subunit alcohol dehydrogenase family)
MASPLAVVTGASSGIGEAFSRQLSGQGFRVLAVARRIDRLKTLEVDTGDRAIGLQQDLASRMRPRSWRGVRRNSEQRTCSSATPDEGSLARSRGWTLGMHRTEVTPLRRTPIEPGAVQNLHNRGLVGRVVTHQPFQRVNSAEPYLDFVVAELLDCC